MTGVALAISRRPQREAFAKGAPESLPNRRRATVPTHGREVERALGVCRWFRQTQRPAAAIRRMGVTSGYGAVPLGLGGQLNPLAEG